VIPSGVGVNLVTALRESQVSALSDSVVDTMADNLIVRYITSACVTLQVSASFVGYEDQFTMNTQIPVSPLASYNAVYNLFWKDHTNRFILLYDQVKAALLLLLCRPDTHAAVSGISTLKSLKYTEQNTTRSGSYHAGDMSQGKSPLNRTAWWGSPEQENFT
jgi:hypothetical protein